MNFDLASKKNQKNPKEGQKDYYIVTENTPDIFVFKNNAKEE
jgi:hypothetical protein